MIDHIIQTENNLHGSISGCTLLLSSKADEVVVIVEGPMNSYPILPSLLSLLLSLPASQSSSDSSL